MSSETPGKSSWGTGILGGRFPTPGNRGAQAVSPRYRGCQAANRDPPNLTPPALEILKLPTRFRVRIRTSGRFWALAEVWKSRGVRKPPGNRSGGPGNPGGRFLTPGNRGARAVIRRDPTPRRQESPRWQSASGRKCRRRENPGNSGKRADRGDSGDPRKVAGKVERTWRPAPEPSEPGRPSCRPSDLDGRQPEPAPTAGGRELRSSTEPAPSRPPAGPKGSSAREPKGDGPWPAAARWLANRRRAVYGGKFEGAFGAKSGLIGCLTSEVRAPPLPPVGPCLAQGPS